ncbi:DUF1702 family protein [Nonomuraea sp. CA-218870]|uniref:DUF1702 family protein n=1 Tax=Nonomuraea sp. CA-218870 TaxID=3239998 RepID=UPI003D9150FD
MEHVGTELVMRPARGWRRLLWKDPSESDLSRRRFRLTRPASRAVVERAEGAYLSGFNAVVSRQAERIEDLPHDLRAFAYEGAGAACAVLDLITLARGRRLRELLAGPAARHAFAVHLGAGRGYATLRLRPVRAAGRTHPLLRWLALDGFGFQWSMARADRMVGERAMPGVLSRAQCALFDQGLGRLLWYHDCASPDDVAARVAAYPVARRAALWSGVGFAAAYTGGAEADELWWLTEHAGADGFRAHLAQGCAFAVAARAQAGPLPDHVAQAAPILAGGTAEEAAGWTDRALPALGPEPYGDGEFLAWQAHTRRLWTRRHQPT